MSKTSIVTCKACGTSYPISLDACPSCGEVTKIAYLSARGQSHVMSTAKMESEVRAASWSQFEATICEIRGMYRTADTGMFYRGQSRAEWPLLTTLERRIGGDYPVEHYYRLMRRIKPEVEAFTGQKWEMPGQDDIIKWTRDYDELNLMLLTGCERLAYSYMAHLRHHAFPSPLLDWTESPYVAAYFAFAKAEDAHDVAVHIFVERPNSSKISGSDAPNIYGVGHYITAHRRHFQQRSRYTLCAQHGVDAGWRFVSHQRVFDLGRASQDVLWKIVMPASLRSEVLRLLDRFNLNEYSLFGSEESLMATLAVREINLGPS